MMAIDRNTSILIVGAGTFGLSTAYHLAKAGYRNITVLEKSPSMPPDLSAANDLNKIVRAEYEDPFYTHLALEAIREWQTTELFVPHFHQTGYLLCTSSTAPEKSRHTLAQSLSSISSHPAFCDQIEPIQSRDDIRRVAPVFDGPMNWKGYFNRLAGYAHSADALRAIYVACGSLGVNVQLGVTVKSLLFDDNVCTGVKTNTNHEYRADCTVLALGASLPSVLSTAGKQMSARAWSVGHIQLTSDEAASLHGIPVTYARDLGFFFEPDAHTNLLKICPAGGGYTNFTYLDPGSRAQEVSIPPKNNSWIPPHDEAKIRNLLHDTLPELAARPIIHKKLCWCIDTADSEYVIDSVPGCRNLVVVAGDSGHAFKMLPIAGRWVRQLLEQDGLQTVDRWRWKDGQGASGDISWRVGQSTDLKDLGIF